MNYEVDPVSGNTVRDSIVEAAKTPAGIMSRFKVLVSQ
jgi:hypothetical protein